MISTSGEKPRVTIRTPRNDIEFCNLYQLSREYHAYHEDSFEIDDLTDIAIYNYFISFYKRKIAAHSCPLKITG